ncbi:MAG: hypothetical protein IJT11_04105 [Bacteroidaceae bacterium]|nr:hypothetical protein [Bacteroidaceae bacterium]
MAVEKRHARGRFFPQQASVFPTASVGLSHSKEEAFPQQAFQIMTVRQKAPKVRQTTDGGVNPRARAIHYIKALKGRQNM